MPEIGASVEGSDCFEVASVEREATPNWAMQTGTRLHLAGLSLSNTVSELERFGVERCRVTVHNWIQKADLRNPRESKCHRTSPQRDKTTKRAVRQSLPVHRTSNRRNVVARKAFCQNQLI